MAEELKPSTFYTVYGEPQLDQSKQDALLYLYQPIIGSKALSLYLNLASDVTIERKSPALMHAELLAAIDIGLSSMIKAREKLEGIGLLRTYKLEDESIGMNLIYQLMTPSDSIDFFQDQLLSFLLIEKIGRTRYDRLVERFKPKVFDMSSAQNITKRFFEVYRLDETSFDSQSDILEQTQSDFTTEEESNWKLFTQQLLQVYKISLTPEEQFNVKQLQILYGLNPLDMARYVANATVAEKDGLNLSYLRKLVDKENRPNPALKRIDKKKNVSINEKFNSKELELIKQSKELTPIDFISSIKNAKGGFVYDGEVTLLDKLIKRNIFDSSVINMMIHYILVIKKNTGINKNYLDSVSNAWAQNNVRTPEEAILYMRNDGNKLIGKSQVDKSKSHHRNTGLRRDLPEYIKNPPKPKKVSAEKEAEVKRRMAEFMRRDGDD
ncbi:DnaD domain protein [Enterococcus sp. DIV0756]|uniref:DnaD domain protein n=1 Tax=Enterococcus sp. DIV0756 TaxID=2774636 RepID=UPI003F1F414D